MAKRLTKKTVAHTGTLTVSRKPPALLSPRLISPPCERAMSNKGSDNLLGQALKAAFELGAETRMIKLNDLNLRACEGYYSKTARARESFARQRE